MTKALLVATAALGMAMSSAGACEFARSAKKLDTTTTASTAQPMSTPVIVNEDTAAAPKVVVEDEG
ncbi:MAG: hypothetical protein KF723_18490 [Rhizobiaceae bacterium]|nr:hypothetical protein [Rhizobiaceae bacterium]